MSSSRTGEETTEEATEAVARLCHSRSLEFEVYAYNREVSKARLDSSRKRGASFKCAKGLFVRLAIDGRIGVGYASDLSGPAMRRCIESAKRLARYHEVDVGWHGFPSARRSYPALRGMRDRALVDADIGELADMADAMAEAAVSEGPAVALSWADVEREIASVSVANSSGIRVSHELAKIRATCSAVNGSGDAISPECIDSQAALTLDIAPASIGSSVGGLAVKSERRVMPKTQECQVVFASGALGFPESGLLSVILREALSGGNLMRGSTFLSGKIGERIASECVTIADNPTAARSCGATPFDDEGMPTRRQRLVDDGVLKGFVWDHRYASAAGRRSSGNAVRDIVSGSVFPRPLNLEFRPGRGDLDSLISEVDDGYLIWGCQGGHTSDAETGDFSFVSSPCFKILRGGVVGGVRGAMVSGNIVDLLGSVVAVGADVKDFGNALVPSMLVEEVRMTSG